MSEPQSEENVILTIETVFEKSDLKHKKPVMGDIFLTDKGLYFIGYAEFEMPNSPRNMGAEGCSSQVRSAVC